MVSNTNIDSKQSGSDTKSLKLLSVNEARKMLGVRYETVKGLIEQGKLQALIIHNRIKIPTWSLLQYQKNAVQDFSNTISNKFESESEVQVVQRILNKNLI